MAPILHWFRRDLRLLDNTALNAAARDGDRVIPVFVLDDHYGNDPDVGPARFRFLRQSLEELARSLEHAGGRLVVRPGPAATALPALLRETGAAAVYANAEIGPYPEARDRAAAAAIEETGAHLRLFPDALLVEPDALLSGSGEPYTVYSPFFRKWLESEKPSPAGRPVRLETPALPTVPIERVHAWNRLGHDADGPPGGETEASRRLADFLSRRLERYGADRDAPAREGTSRLSPHLHFGTISPRTIAAAIEEASREDPRTRPGARKFLAELAWREFYHHVLHHFPRVSRQSFRPELDRMDWHGEGAPFDAWREGRTGYPLVDAGMRQLASTHWMHNRARMVVASFLTKDLHVHWTHGARWFERALADADLANNAGGWQWAAGTGADAAPYFRIFNPILQSKKFDPEGDYIRRYVPALSRVPAARIHEPWAMTETEQNESGCRIGRDYPAPIVDHAAERAVALEMYERLKKPS